MSPWEGCKGGENGGRRREREGGREKKERKEKKKKTKTNVKQLRHTNIVQEHI